MDEDYSGWLYGEPEKKGCLADFLYFAPTIIFVMILTIALVIAILREVGF